MGTEVFMTFFKKARGLLNLERLDAISETQLTEYVTKKPYFKSHLVTRNESLENP